MLARIAFLLFAATAATPAFSAEIAALSKVDAVTVFPSGAEITRVATSKVDAGEHMLVFDNLPGDLMTETIRVEGDAEARIEIGSVDARLLHVSSAEIDARRKVLNDQVQALQDERAKLDQVISDAEYQKSLMQQLAASAFTAPGKGDDKPVFGPAELGQLLDLVGGKLQVFSTLVTDSRLRQRDIDLKINETYTQIGELAPQGQARMRVTVHLVAPVATSGQFRLRYRIAGAGWQPIYDARLTSPDKATAAKIELVRRAAVLQSSTERWDNVALTLSTARPAGATAAPDIAPERVDGFEVGRAANYSRRSDGALQAPAPAAEALTENDQVAKSSVADEKKKEDVQQLQALVEVAGFQALYAIPGRVTVDNTGTAKNVRIDTSSLNATMSARAVPKLDPNAYLTAAFTVDGETPMLPGTVMLYRDGVFMGQGWLPMLSPGEESKLGFGADDLIKVKRVEVKRQRGEEGLLTTSNVDERAYDITVKNLHDFAIPVTVLDQMPYSTLEDITVGVLPGMTAPTIRDFEKKRGVLAWGFELEPKAEKVIKHGFKITWPEDMQVGMNLN